jgi:hypothetical protein
MVVSFACLVAVVRVTVAGPLAAQPAGQAMTGTVMAGPEAPEGDENIDAAQINMVSLRGAGVQSVFKRSMPSDLIQG